MFKQLQVIKKNHRKENKILLQYHHLSDVSDSLPLRKFIHIHLFVEWLVFWIIDFRIPLSFVNICIKSWLQIPVT